MRANFNALHDAFYDNCCPRRSTSCPINAGNLTRRMRGLQSLTQLVISVHETGRCSPSMTCWQPTMNVPSSAVTSIGGEPDPARPAGRVNRRERLHPACIKDWRTTRLGSAFRTFGGMGPGSQRLRCDMRATRHDHADNVSYHHGSSVRPQPSAGPTCKLYASTVGNTLQLRCIGPVRVL